MSNYIFPFQKINLQILSKASRNNAKQRETTRNNAKRHET